MEGVIWFILFPLTFGIGKSEIDLTQEPGHLQPFGSGRPTFHVDEIDGFPDAKVFLRDYVIASKPMKLKNAAKLSPAFKLWTDDYFMTLDIPEETSVHLETRKKEDRKQETVDMHFKEFIKIYNKTELYMVDNVPQYLWNDVLFPCPIQCTQLMEESVLAVMMWFSSGGTKSVVHADAVDNINCLFRGEKTFIMVDTNKYREKVDLDHPEGLYSSVDVDKVDYTKFPGLAEVEYFHVNVSAGDCLYIPYRWIHQVRSYGSNLAVNFWWDHYKSRDTNLDTCADTCDQSLFLSAVKQQGMNSFMYSVGSIKDQMFTSVAVRNLDIVEFRKAVVAAHLEMIEDETEQRKMTDLYNDITQEFFSLMDVDNDKVISKDDLEALPDEAWWDAQTYIAEIDQLLSGEDEEYEDDDEDEDDDDDDFDDEDDDLEVHDEL